MSEPQRVDAGDIAARIKAVRAEMREMERPARERKLRRGLAKPRTAAEWRIFAADLLDSDAPGDEKPAE